MRKLTVKEAALFKIAVWTCLVVWLVFFFANSLILAKTAGLLAPVWYPGMWGSVARWGLPIWIVFTSLLIVVGIAGFARKKLS